MFRRVYILVSCYALQECIYFHYECVVTLWSRSEAEGGLYHPAHHSRPVNRQQTNNGPVSPRVTQKRLRWICCRFPRPLALHTQNKNMKVYITKVCWRKMQPKHEIYVLISCKNMYRIPNKVMQPFSACWKTLYFEHLVHGMFVSVLTGLSSFWSWCLCSVGGTSCALTERLWLHIVVYNWLSTAGAWLSTAGALLSTAADIYTLIRHIHVDTIITFLRGWLCKKNVWQGQEGRRWRKEKVFSPEERTRFIYFFFF